MATKFYRETFVGVISSDQSVISKAKTWAQENVLELGFTLMGVEIECGCNWSAVEDTPLAVLGAAAYSPQGTTVVTVTYSTARKKYPKGHALDILLYWSYTKYPRAFNRQLENALKLVSSNGAEVLSCSATCGCSPGWFKGSGLVYYCLKFLTLPLSLLYGGLGALAPQGIMLSAVAYIASKDVRDTINATWYTSLMRSVAGSHAKKNVVSESQELADLPDKRQQETQG